MSVGRGLAARALAASVLVLEFTGCVTDPGPPPVPPPDAAPFDAPRDATPLDAPRADAPRPDAPRPDAPLDAPPGDSPIAADDAPSRLDATSARLTIDGRLDEPAWSRATVTTSTLDGAGLFAGCALTRLALTVEDDALAIGLEATLCRGTLVLYLDRDPGAARGVVLNGTPLGDRVGSPDDVLSGALLAVNPEFLPDLGWGTRAMPSPAGSGPAAWRTLSASGSFGGLGGVDRSACTATACETAIPLTTLGLASGDTVTVTARIGEPDLWSNLALPEDAPGTVERVLGFTVP